jgi:hypothetical protein
MNEIINIILKHDGYIWGPYVHAYIRGDECTGELNCRFVSKSLFEPMTTLPHQFLIDLNQSFKIRCIKKNTVTVDNGISIHVRVHSMTDELKFLDECDFTCNLLDYRRDGLFLRYVPQCITYDVCPYATVIQSIKKKELVPVNTTFTLESLQKYIDAGWSGNFYTIGSECPVCSDDVTDQLSFTMKCGHSCHVDCLKKWLPKNPTCPMCREYV